MKRYFKKLGIIWIACLSVAVLADEKNVTHSSYSSSSDEGIKESILTLIQVRHPKDSSETWKSLGPNAPKVILSLYRESQSIYKKIRLIEALSWFEDDEALAFLKSVYLESNNSIEKGAALKAIALSRGVQEREFLEKALKSSDPHLKVKVARILDQTHEKKAAQIVDQLIKEEKDPAVVHRIRPIIKSDSTDLNSTQNIKLKSLNPQKALKIIRPSL